MRRRQAAQEWEWEINDEQMRRLVTYAVILLWSVTAQGHYWVKDIPGDQIIVAVDPSRTTLYRENTLYLRAVEHQREGFVYVHNVRQLFPIDKEDNILLRHLHEVN